MKLIVFLSPGFLNLASSISAQIPETRDFDLDVRGKKSMWVFDWKRGELKILPDNVEHIRDGHSTVAVNNLKRVHQRQVSMLKKIRQKIEKRVKDMRMWNESLTLP